MVTFKQKIDTKADIWMFGCVVYAVMFKEHPFEAAQKLTIEKAFYKFPKNNTFADKLCDFVRLCLNPDVNERPDIDEVINILNSWSEKKTIVLPVNF